MVDETNKNADADDPQLARAHELIREGRVGAGCAEYVRYADKCVTRGDIVEAIRYLYKVEEYQLLDIRSKRRLAELLANVGNKSRAVATFVEVAASFEQQGLHDDAVDTLRNAIQLLPDRLVLKYRLAEQYDRSGQTQKAVSIYLQVLEDSPYEIEALEALGRLYIKRNSTGEAIDVFLRAVRINEERGEMYEAAREYETILPLLPDKTPALKRLIEVYGRLGFKSEMVQTMLELARLADERGEKERALMIYAKVLEVEPTDETAQAHIGKSIQVVSILPSGDSLITPDGLNPDDEAPTEPEPAPGETAFPPGKIIRTVDDLLGFRPDTGEGEIAESPQVCYDLGLAYLEMGITEEAIHYLQLASRDVALRIRACNMLGLCFLQKEMPELAVKEFERGLNTPNVAESEAIGLYYNLATAYERLGDFKRALDELQKVYAVDIHYLDAREKLRKMRARLTGQ